MFKEPFICLFRSVFNQRGRVGEGASGSIEAGGAAPEAPTTLDGTPDKAGEKSKEGKEKNEPFSEYIHSLKNEKRDDFKKVAHMMREREETRNDPAYTKAWTGDPRIAADFIEDYFPDGEEKAKLVEGLRVDILEAGKDPDRASEVKDFQDATNLGLKPIIEMLNKENKPYYDSRADRQKELNHEGLVSGNLKQGVSNLIDNFERGDAYDKALTIAACTATFFVIKHFWKKPIPGFPKTKWSEGGGYVAIAWALNELSSKVSNDGKTLLQRLSLGTPADSLRAGPWLAFALEGRDKDKEKNMAQESPKEADTMMRLGPLNMENITKIYARESVHKSKKFEVSDFQRMGMSSTEANQMDGATAFKCVEKLVQISGENYAKRYDDAQKARLAAESGKTPGQIQLPRRKPESWQVNLSRLEVEYPAASRYRFEDVMVQEMTEKYGDENVEGVSEKMREAMNADSIVGVAKATAEAGLTSVANKATEFADWTTKKSKAAAGWFAEEWNDKYPQVKRFFGEKEEKIVMDGITAISTKAFDTKDHLKIIEPATLDKPGKILIKGVPFDYSIKGKADQIITIDGKDFSKTTDVINKQNAEALEKQAQETVVKLIDKSSVNGSSALKDKFTWDEKDDAWVHQMDVAPLPALLIKGSTVNVTAKVTDDGKKAEFYVDNQLVTDFAKLSETYHGSEITKAIYRDYPILDGMPIVYTSIVPNGPVLPPSPPLLTMPSRIRVSIEISHGTPFTFDLDSNKPIHFTNELDALVLTNNMADALVESLAGSQQFHDHFDQIDNIISQSSAGVFDRLKNTWGTASLTPATGAVNRTVSFVKDVYGWAAKSGSLINGPILQKRAQYILEYKKSEVLYSIKEQLHGRITSGGINLGDARDIVIQPIIKKFDDIQNSMAADASANQIPATFSKHLADIEHANYQNQIYKDKFDEFTKMISGDQWDYEGMESIDNSETPHVIFTRLLSVWYYYTSNLNVPNVSAINDPNNVPYTATTEAVALDQAIADIQAEMIKFQASDGKIKVDEVEEPKEWEHIRLLVKTK